MHVLLQYCRSDSAARRAEFDYCVRQTLEHPAVVAVHNLVETATPVPADISGHAKYRESRGERWLTFERAFDYANTALPQGSTCYLSNLDVFPSSESDWTAAHQWLSQDRRRVLCLSRHEWAPEREPWLDTSASRLGMANTQDAWVFCTPLHVSDVGFRLGQPGCDNAIADRLRRAGYLPVNAPFTFRIMHYDRLRDSQPLSDRWQHQRKMDYHDRPEEQGQLLLPAFERVTSIDNLLRDLGVTDLQKYEIICELMSRFIKIRNP